MCATGRRTLPLREPSRHATRAAADGKSYWKSRVGDDLEAFIYRRPGENHFRHKLKA